MVLQLKLGDPCFQVPPFTGGDQLTQAGGIDPATELWAYLGGLADVPPAKTQRPHWLTEGERRFLASIKLWLQIVHRMNITPDAISKSSGVSAGVPIRKTPPYRTIVRNLLASKKLSKAEDTAFQKIQNRLLEGHDLEQSQRLWIETLNAKYLAKK
jgi:hypothetical protein